jgi:hypothetical protein
MKNLILILAGILFLTLVTNAQYKINKLHYDYRTYKHLPGDRYDPAAACVMSILLPGTGQMVSGEIKRGAAFVGGSFGCYVIVVLGFAGASGARTDEAGTFFTGTMFLGIAGMAAVDIWSAIDAVRVAKVKNLALRDKNKTSYNIQLQPYINTACYNHTGSVPVGVSLKIKF